mmetsp:Transcript_44836/g.65530  ORF Transcript_44836/g.65530 Transcript_44836/m.65530 type:complete len:119 (+) Transcript_44836:67-423(+)
MAYSGPLFDIKSHVSGQFALELLERVENCEAGLVQHDVSLTAMLAGYIEASQVEGKRTRRKLMLRKRLDWQEHVNTLLNEGLFHTMYRMQYSDFLVLCEMLAPHSTKSREIKKPVRRH